MVTSPNVGELSSSQKKSAIGANFLTDIGTCLSDISNVSRGTTRPVSSARFLGARVSSSESLF